ncbi:hypothetical protein B0G75_103673 [Paraburkholderia sp. BL18I3N2]|nr:hypothetical protein B0G75_103673 [Paraburkholderia sp. BL18I3N2]
MVQFGDIMSAGFQHPFPAAANSVAQGKIVSAQQAV